jgi:hypothetical protein
MYVVFVYVFRTFEDARASASFIIDKIYNLKFDLNSKIDGLFYKTADDNHESFQILGTENDLRFVFAATF